MSGRQRAIDTTDLRSRAVFLNGEGFRVFPVRVVVEPDGGIRKIPVIERYHGDQPFQEKAIRSWQWSVAKVLGWALPPGYIALDIDVKNGQQGYEHLAQLEAELGELPRTRSQQTPSGGMHWVFAVNGVVPTLPGRVPMVETGRDRTLSTDTTATATSTGVADIDICHPGHRYLVLYQTSMLLEPVAELPERWLNHIAKGRRSRSKGRGTKVGPGVPRSVPRALETLANAEKGNRNNTLNLTVLQNASSIDADSDVRNAFIRHAEMSGLEREEIDTTIDSALAAADRDTENAEKWFNALVDDPRVHECRNSADLLLLAHRLSLLSSSFGPVVGWSVRDAAESLGVHSATAARRLKTLVNLGYLEIHQPSNKDTATQYLLTTPVRNYCNSPQLIPTSTKRTSSKDVYGGMSQNFPFRLLDDVYCHPAFLEMKGSVSLPKSCARVLVAVQRGAIRRSNIAKASELSAPTVRKAVNILQSAGLVQVDEDGLVRLTDPDIMQALDRWATWSGASINRTLLKERHRAERLKRDKSIGKLDVA